ncbi:hypothetical protein PROFUN_09169 [Planoprotostelium fungivorum]|uniref:Uncharacterized protein n=1 Tax=Planoprotostelium fungivorum TaxID=1890364 RepID=A0A2P6MVL6_9EUKA|nr:hypothetical protein PROFUN_09169 [Planoprotostelium fungivorum]
MEEEPPQKKRMVLPQLPADFEEDAESFEHTEHHEPNLIHHLPNDEDEDAPPSDHEDPMEQMVQVPPSEDSFGHIRRYYKDTFFVDPWEKLPVVSEPLPSLHANRQSSFRPPCNFGPDCNDHNPRGAEAIEVEGEEEGEEEEEATVVEIVGEGITVTNTDGTIIIWVDIQTIVMLAGGYTNDGLPLSFGQQRRGHWRGNQ